MENILNSQPFLKLIAVATKIKDKIYAKNVEKEKNQINIVNELDDVISQLEYAKIEFNLETDYNMIDTHIFRIQTLETLRNYLLNKAKQERIYCSPYDRKYNQKA